MAENVDGEDQPPPVSNPNSGFQAASSADRYPSLDPDAPFSFATGE
jgi:hypothetical protein